MYQDVITPSPETPTPTSFISEVYTRTAQNQTSSSCHLSSSQDSTLPPPSFQELKNPHCPSLPQSNSEGLYPLLCPLLAVVVVFQARCHRWRRPRFPFCPQGAKLSLRFLGVHLPHPAPILGFRFAVYLDPVGSPSLQHRCLE